MGTSEIRYGDRAFSAPDAILEVLVKLLVVELDRLSKQPEWILELRDDWLTQATNEFGFGIQLELDRYLSTDARRLVIGTAAKAARAQLLSLGDPIAASALNAIGAGKPGSLFEHDLPAETFIDVADDFVDLLDIRDAGVTIVSQAQLADALAAHAQWMKDPTTGKRLCMVGGGFADADLTGRELNRARLTRVDLRGAKCAGAKFAKAELFDVNLDRSDLTGAAFIKSKLKGCSFVQAKAQGLTFRSTIAEDCSFIGSDLQASILETGSLFRVKVCDANAAGARVTATISGDLRRCNFSDANLSRAKFLDADLRDANFAGTSLVGTSFKRVRLHGARGVPFQAAKLTAASIDFSPTGDGTTPGTIAALRKQLGGPPGDEPWGTATTLEQYAALSVREGSGHHFAIERRSDRTEVIRVNSLALRGSQLLLEYQVLDPQLSESVVRYLIPRVLLTSEVVTSEFHETWTTVEYKEIRM